MQQDTNPTHIHSTRRRCLGHWVELDLQGLGLRLLTADSFNVFGVGAMRMRLVPRV